jgi:hypothetical protein
MEFADTLKNLSNSELEEVYTDLICMLRKLEFKDNPTLLDKICMKFMSG